VHLSPLDVKRGEEFFVDYGYERDDCPAWYTAFMNGHWPDVPTYGREVERIERMRRRIAMHWMARKQESSS
jgi:hypothetical protein